MGSKKLETDDKPGEAAGNARKAVGEAKDVVLDAVEDRTKLAADVVASALLRIVRKRRHQSKF